MNFRGRLQQIIFEFFQSINSTYWSLIKLTISSDQMMCVLGEIRSVPCRCNSFDDINFTAGWRRTIIVSLQLFLVTSFAKIIPNFRIFFFKVLSLLNFLYNPRACELCADVFAQRVPLLILINFQRVKYLRVCEKLEGRVLIQDLKLSLLSCPAFSLQGLFLFEGSHLRSHLLWIKGAILHVWFDGRIHLQLMKFFPKLLKLGTQFYFLLIFYHHEFNCVKINRARCRKVFAYDLSTSNFWARLVCDIKLLHFLWDHFCWVFRRFWAWLSFVNMSTRHIMGWKTRNLVFFLKV